MFKSHKAKLQPKEYRNYRIQNIIHDFSNSITDLVNRSIGLLFIFKFQALKLTQISMVCISNRKQRGSIILPYLKLLFGLKNVIDKSFHVSPICQLISTVGRQSKRLFVVIGLFKHKCKCLQKENSRDGKEKPNSIFLPVICQTANMTLERRISCPEFRSSNTTASFFLVLSLSASNYLHNPQGNYILLIDFQNR